MFEEWSVTGNEEEVEVFPLLTLDDEEDSKELEIPETLPLLPLRNTVLFPGVVLPITVGRGRSIKAVKEAIKSGRLIGVVAQRDSAIEEPDKAHLHDTGTVARIVKELQMPDGSTTVIIQGKKRFKLNEFVHDQPYIRAGVQVLSESEQKPKDNVFSATLSSIKDLSARIIKLSPNIPSEANIVMKNITNPVFLMHFISSNLNRDVIDKQAILETEELTARGEVVLKYLQDEVQMLELKNKIQSKVRTDIEKQQRDYFLNQQMKQIQEELGGDTFDQELNDLKARALKMKWPEIVAKAFDKDIQKLQRINPSSAEYSVQLNYLELLLELPWGEYTNDNFDLAHAKEILDRDHFGLNKVKKRLLEYLAVLKLKGDMKSPIICLVGPPGVGKTSLGKSVAQALGRKYVRMSLGGLHDESEVRGHRKTYIGAMPGRIVQSLKKVKSSNPVFILDEIDKVGTDFRGDPSSALLEVLDPEQNETFHDNYLELEYDLSKVLFIATANDLNSIQPALRDRMEIIYINGYSVEEKLEIARKHLFPKQRAAHGLKAKQVKLGKASLEKIVSEYTRESGVRDLERKIAGVMRSVAMSVAEDDSHVSLVKPEDIHDILGAAKFDNTQYQEEFPAGVATGLAWTSVGGEILFVESVISKGTPGLTLTGNLGDVMKESAATALTYIKAHAEELGVDQEELDSSSIHIHVPEGAIPKDGPSAGVTMLSAMTSAFTGRKLKARYAMTGEITLRGKVLPVGGIKEKMLAAKRAGMKDIILCHLNRKDVDEINENYIKGIRFHYVEYMNEVIDLVLKKR